MRQVLTRESGTLHEPAPPTGGEAKDALDEMAFHLREPALQSISQRTAERRIMQDHGRASRERDIGPVTSR